MQWRLLLSAMMVALVRAGELHQAARACDPPRMQQLLSSKPPLNEPDEHGMTALHVAIEARQSTCVWLLIQAGADRKVRDRQGRTAYDAVAQGGDPQIDFLVQNLGGIAVAREGFGLPLWSLEYAVIRRQTDVTKMLLALGADPNAMGRGGTLPLGDAALKGDLEIVRALLARGARPNLVSKAGTQPLHDAALGDNGDVIRELAKQGAELNARTRDESQTPLHIAAAMGKAKSVEALVVLGADLAAKDTNGRTPVESARRAGLTEVVAMLQRAAAAKH